MTITIQVDMRVVIAILFGLVAFGWGYNRWVAVVTSRGQDRGYLSFIVALGVLVTIAGFTLIVWSWPVGLLLLVCFAASGVPMMIGSVQRYVQARAKEEARAWASARRGIAHD